MRLLYVPCLSGRVLVAHVREQRWLLSSEITCPHATPDAHGVIIKLAIIGDLDVLIVSRLGHLRHAEAQCVRRCSIAIGDAEASSEMSPASVDTSGLQNCPCDHKSLDSGMPLGVFNCGREARGPEHLLSALGLGQCWGTPRESLVRRPAVWKPGHG